MNAFLTIAPLLITLIGLIYYTRKKMQKLGVIYVIVFYIKWFLGIVVTMSSFYIIMITGDYLKENGFSVLFSLPVGVFVWFVPMHYISKFFTSLEDKYKKELDSCVKHENDGVY